ncbi:Swi5-domain-containing protein [Coniochaeta ligniaria NRRL 30616]|uniref:Swi5-domain-containing protein n=1 Tax=Coniochaeta ligniaria NRRL 30616 TaxID=1408157 RepID=A0A1J7JHX9_9PEZI|nr:Swi5-domain-containing protein [Coniochaeta ligniaria NRRL 30616]
MNGQGTSSLVNSALASYHCIVDGQIESVAELETWLTDRSASDKAYQDIASSVYPLIASNKAQLLEARHTHLWSYSPASSPWGTITWARTSTATISVTGLGNEPHKRFELHANSDSDINSIEKFVSLLASAFDNLAAAEGHIARLAQLMDGMETSAISGSPAETVHNHIQQLGQYNEAKDIAQQLIGLIADNRGVPVGSLYQDEQYGVGPND